MTSFDHMDSIWVDDAPKAGHKLYANVPSVKLINSETPIILSKKTIDLPPLPPTSFFQQAMTDNEQKKKDHKKFLNIFKKLTLAEKETKEKAAPRKKISTPYDFNHISHIDNQPPASVNMPKLQPPSPKAFAFNTTLPSASNSETIKRSHSAATSLNSSSAFTRSGSISTMDTTISKTKSLKYSSPKHVSHTSISNQEQIISNSSMVSKKNNVQQSISPSHSTKSLTPNYKFPSDFQDWKTSESTEDLVKAWINEDITPTPLSRKSRSNSVVKSRKSSTRSSSSGSFDIDNYQTEIESSFENSADSEYKKIIASIYEFEEFLDHDEELSKDSIMMDHSQIKDTTRSKSFKKSTRSSSISKLTENPASLDHNEKFIETSNYI